MKSFLLLIGLFLAVSILGADLTKGNLCKNSAYWPQKVLVTEVAGKKNDLQVGDRGVLIRIEEESPLVVVDFGRNGVHRLGIDQTDVLARAKAIKVGERQKLRPNYLAMLGPPKLFCSKDGKMSAVSNADAKDWKGFLFIYLSETDLNWEALGDMLKENREPLQEHGLQPVLFPLYRTKDEPVFGSLVENSLPVAVMHDFLSHSFINVLQHRPGEGPLLVATDLNGKILAESRAFTLAPLWDFLLNLN